MAQRLPARGQSEQGGGVEVGLDGDSIEKVRLSARYRIGLVHGEVSRRRPAPDGVDRALQHREPVAQVAADGQHRRRVPPLIGGREIVTATPSKGTPTGASGSGTVTSIDSIADRGRATA
jgi:hypothetical protein